MKLIINADDCGKNKQINESIEKYIKLGKITSTTVLANMDDLEGASEIYKKYKDNISFGVHLNLTEGHPLIISQLLIQEGLYIEKEDGVYFNLSSYRNRIFTYNIIKEINKELDTQISRIRDYGINISHIDSHHHIHTGIAFIHLIPILAKRHNINRIRRMRNYVPNSTKINLFMRDTWWTIINLQNTSLKSTNYFGIFEDWYDNLQRNLHPINGSLELMCHPGSKTSENEKLLSINFKNYNDINLISYNEIQ